MTIKAFNIEDLQPTNPLDANTALKYKSASNTVLKTERPQVWDTCEGLIISDGNHHSAEWFRRGKRRISVEYFDAKDVTEVSRYDCGILNEVMERARAMRKMGVYSPGDLWKS